MKEYKERKHKRTSIVKNRCADRKHGKGRSRRRIATTSTFPCTQSVTTTSFKCPPWLAGSCIPCMAFRHFRAVRRSVRAYLLLIPRRRTFHPLVTYLLLAKFHIALFPITIHNVTFVQLRKQTYFHNIRSLVHCLDFSNIVSFHIGSTTFWPFLR